MPWLKVSGRRGRGGVHCRLVTLRRAGRRRALKTAYYDVIASWGSKQKEFATRQIATGVYTTARRLRAD